MHKGIYVIYDNKAEDIMGPPIITRHAAVAQRSFTDIMVMQDSKIADHNEDYDLLCLGYFQDDNLTIIPTAAADRIIITGKALYAVLAAKQATTEQARPVPIALER